jgi:hypothetical protein
MQGFFRTTLSMQDVYWVPWHELAKFLAQNSKERWKPPLEDFGTNF